MKKTVVLFAAMVMAAVSCQKENSTKLGNDVQGSGKLTATFVQSKVSYTETSNNNIQPAWEIGDKIIGFDETGDTYTLTVASVSKEIATLSGTVPDGAIHLIYKSGAQASDISAKTLAVDYTAQAGDKTMPAVMLADGTVTDGSCNFVFSNAGAIIGISSVKAGSDEPFDEVQKGPAGPADEEHEEPTGPISKVTIEGANLSAATVALSNGTLILNEKTNVLDAISTATLSGIEVTDDGTLNEPVFFAVPAGAIINRIKIDRYSYTFPMRRTVEAGQYLCVKDQQFKPMVTYTVHYLRNDNKAKLLPDKVVDCEIGDKITEMYVPVHGYRLFSENAAIEAVIEKDNMEFTFYYAPDNLF